MKKLSIILFLVPSLSWGEENCEGVSFKYNLDSTTHIRLDIKNKTKKHIILNEIRFYGNKSKLL